MEKRIIKDNSLFEQILTVAEPMFKEFGYEATTFQKISDKIGITKGAITYHFKNKYMIVYYLIDRYFQLLKNFVDTTSAGTFNSYLRQCIVYIYVNRNILKSERSRDLFYHQGQMRLWETGKVETVAEIYRSIARDFQKVFSEEELLMTAYMDLGARHRVYGEFLKEDTTITIEKYCYYHIYFMGLLAKLDEATIQRNIKAAFEFADIHEPPTILLFSHSQSEVE